MMDEKDLAVIVVDVQADFTEFRNGALAIQGAWMHPTAIRYVLDSQRKLLEEFAASRGSADDVRSHLK